MINFLFLGVPVVLLAMDKYVAIYNMVAAFGVIVITLLVRLCFFRKFLLSDLTNYLYLLSSLWLTALIIWATVEGNINSAKYETVSIVQNEYFNIITGVLIACNPVVLAVVLFIVGIPCCLIVLVLALIVLVPVGIYYGMRFLYRQCKKRC